MTMLSTTWNLEGQESPLIDERIAEQLFYIPTEYLQTLAEKGFLNAISLSRTPVDVLIPLLVDLGIPPGIAVHIKAQFPDDFSDHYRKERLKNGKQSKLITPHLVVTDENIYEVVKYNYLGHADFSSMDIPMVNLNDKILFAADFRHANLYEATLVRTIAKQAIFQSAHMVRTNLTEAILDSAQMRIVNLSFATCIRTSLVSVNIKHALLIRCNLQEANLSRSWLVKSDLAGANLREVRMVDVNCYGASFMSIPKERRDSNESGPKDHANFTGAVLENVNFQEALIDIELLQQQATQLINVKLPDGTVINRTDPAKIPNPTKEDIESPSIFKK